MPSPAKASIRRVHTPRYGPPLEQLNSPLPRLSTWKKRIFGLVVTARTPSPLAWIDASWQVQIGHCQQGCKEDQLAKQTEPGASGVTDATPRSRLTNGGF